MRSVHLHKDKAIFKVADLPANEFAESLGLPGAPKIKFLSKEITKQKKNADRRADTAKQQALGKKEESNEESDGDLHLSSEEEEGSEHESEPAANKNPLKVCFGRRTIIHLIDHLSRMEVYEPNTIECLNVKIRTFFHSTTPNSSNKMLDLMKMTLSHSNAQIMILVTRHHSKK
jgi:hypothetical protein